jgi:hypothetical protein
MRKLITFAFILLFCSPSFSQIKKVSIGANYDYFHELQDGKIYRIKNKIIVVGFSKNWKGKELNINNFVEGSLGLTYKPITKTFDDSVTITAPTFARVNFEVGKRITAYSKKALDINFIFSFGAFSDFGDNSRLKKPINFRVIPSVELMFFKHIFISGSAYKILIPISPTGINIRTGIKFAF